MNFGNTNGFASVLVVLAALMAIVSLVYYYWSRSLQGRSRTPYASTLRSRGDFSSDVWRGRVTPSFPIAELCDCVKTELGWPSASFHPDDLCEDIFNCNDGYGYGIDDLQIELANRFQASVPIDEFVLLATNRSKFNSFVELVERHRRHVQN